MHQKGLITYTTIKRIIYCYRFAIPGRVEAAEAELLLVRVSDLLVQGRQLRAHQSNPGSGPREVEARNAGQDF